MSARRKPKTAKAKPQTQSLDDSDLFITSNAVDGLGDGFSVGPSLSQLPDHTLSKRSKLSKPQVKGTVTLAQPPRTLFDFFRTTSSCSVASSTPTSVYSNQSSLPTPTFEPCDDTIDSLSAIAFPQSSQGCSMPSFTMSRSDEQKVKPKPRQAIQLNMSEFVCKDVSKTFTENAVAATRLFHRKLTDEQAAFVASVSARLDVHQQRVVRLMLSGMSIAVMGKGGTGKTWTVMHGAREDALIMCVSASVAANLRRQHFAIHGDTTGKNIHIGHIHRMLHIPVDASTVSDWLKSICSTKRKTVVAELKAMVSSVKCVIYDEVYAGGTNLFSLTSDIIEWLVMQVYKDTPEGKTKRRPSSLKAPFGGKQVVAIGDPGQAMKSIKKNVYDYVFQNNPYTQLFPDETSHVVLRIVHRQENPELQLIAEMTSYGDLETAVALLRKLPVVSKDKLEPSMCPVIANKRETVDAINKLMYSRVSGQEYGPYIAVLSTDAKSAERFYARHNKDFVPQAFVDQYEIPFDRKMWQDARMPPDAIQPLMLKDGVRLMINTNISNTWTNGVFCRVVGFTPLSEPIVMREEVYNERDKLHKAAMSSDPNISETDFVLYDLEKDIAKDVVTIIKQYAFSRPVHYKCDNRVETCMFEYKIYPVVYCYALSSVRAQGLTFTTTTAIIDPQYAPNLDVVKFSRASRKMYICGGIPKNYTLLRDETTTQFYKKMLEATVARGV